LLFSECESRRRPEFLVIFEDQFNEALTCWSLASRYPSVSALLGICNETIGGFIVKEEAKQRKKKPEQQAPSLESKLYSPRKVFAFMLLYFIQEDHRRIIRFELKLMLYVWKCI
jgi:hypothetical protein